MKKIIMTAVLAAGLTSVAALEASAQNWGPNNGGYNNNNGWGGNNNWGPFNSDGRGNGTGNFTMGFTGSAEGQGAGEGQGEGQGSSEGYGYGNAGNTGIFMGPNGQLMMMGPNGPIAIQVVPMEAPVEAPAAPAASE